MGVNRHPCAIPSAAETILIARRLQAIAEELFHAYGGNISQYLSERVTVTMPAELVAGIDRIERRQRQELLRSLQEPHPDSLITAELGLETWSQGRRAGRSRMHEPGQGALFPDLAPGASGLTKPSAAELEAIDRGLCLYLGLEAGL